MQTDDVTIATQNVDDIVLMMIDSEHTPDFVLKGVLHLKTVVTFLIGPTLSFGTIVLPDWYSINSKSMLISSSRKDEVSVPSMCK